MANDGQQFDIDIDKIVTDLNLKAGTDLVNVNNTGTSLGGVEHAFQCL